MNVPSCVDRGIHGIAKPLNHGVERGSVWTVGQNHHKLVAAQAGRGIALSAMLCQPLTDGHQHLIADVVTMGVVDGLEAVQIEQDDRMAAWFGQQPLGALGQTARLARPVKGALSRLLGPVGWHWQRSATLFR
ncbi:MAG: hypothetical protein LRY31_01655, partial [Burkholderiaceae bacterium]|nr:hypothetical protein [Burkholderiaceae bacterium]